MEGRQKALTAVVLKGYKEEGVDSVGQGREAQLPPQTPTQVALWACCIMDQEVQVPEAICRRLGLP